MIDFISPLLGFIWPILLAIAGFLGLFFYGKKKKADGIAQERERSREAVREVETTMAKKIAKPRTMSETRKRLDEGNF